MYLCSYLGVYRKIFFHAIGNTLSDKHYNMLYPVEVSQRCLFGVGVLTSWKIVFPD